MSVTRVPRRGPVRSSSPAATKAKSRPKKAPARTRPASDGFGPAKARAFDLPALLESASRVRRGRGPEGAEALISKPERARVVALFGSVPAATVKTLQALLLAVPEGAHQAVLLKGIAARADDPGSRSLKALETFAKLIAPLGVDEVLERSTVLDLDSGVNTSTTDALPWWNKRGTIKDVPGDSAAADNDGLIQRFTSSCGPTVIQMMRAQVDPVLAFAINDEGRTSDSTTSATARFQRALLEEYGDVAVGRRESYVMSRINNALGRLGLGTNDLSDTAIAKVRAAYDGFPADADLKRVRTALVGVRDKGIAFDDFKAMIARYVSRVSGAEYTQTAPPEGFARGQAYRHLDALEASLKAGFDVPFGMVEPAHWMLATDVRQRAGAREFLVSDPDGGRTVWVTEKALVDGSFGDAPFKLTKTGERPYIDSFFLPTL